MARNTRLLENARQDVNDLYRQFPDGVVHFNYESKTATVFTNGVKENALIFGVEFETYSGLAHGAKRCETKKILERMKAVTAA